MKKHPRTSPGVELVTDQHIIETAYEKAYVDLRLQEYAFFGHGSPESRLPEAHLQSTIIRYTQLLLPFAVNADSLNIGLIRLAHDRFIDGANLASNEKLGYERARTITDVLLQKAGLRKPAIHEDYSKDDDAFWLQFGEDFKNQRSISPQADELVEHHAGRVISQHFWHNPGTQFTYLPQAYRRS